VPFSALLFDLDGTLVDTITLYGQAVLRSLEEIGIQATEDEFRDWYIRPLHLGQILALYGRTEDQIPALRLRRDALYEELLRTKVEWLPGAEELLETVKKKNPKSPTMPRSPRKQHSSESSDSSASSDSSRPLALITGSWLSYVNAVDSRLRVKRFFDPIITADEIHACMKPNPYGLLLACDRLGVDPKTCLYIGDQQFDIDAAHAAGMEAWLLKGEWSPENVANADKTFDALAQISEALR